ncbi:hypothetical protein GD627_11905 [Arthrobacter yangruifuii]|uniref:Uncharacterized protein n=1 Tax=Arthrobacter yangruifuii TaxID=2606616 RepID=A0A5N6MGK3_9MICC|nr:hypothetical protein [Arthrobacter yangruifuii]KAD3515008.1 hypothetical protein GD627_11905 [Arthrobacter yangruifuii]
MVDVSAFNESDLRSRGFAGFKAFGDLDLSTVPREPGVYSVLRSTNSTHEVLDTSVGGWFKGTDPTDDPAKLKGRLWDAPTIYIGKADAGANGTRGLRKRIGEFAKFGQGLAVGHKGGRYIWQLSNSRDLRIAWLPVTDRSAKVVEDELMEEFFVAYGQLPFANLRR